VPPRCVDCGDVIGVYEPLVAMVGDGIPRETSRAAEPRWVAAAPGAIYHSDCYRTRRMGSAGEQAASVWSLGS
jgi:hypothetical protein